jgi:hypothetical protein
MTSFIRRHLSYANVVATLALLFAMGGSAIAARHYVLTSISQIKPSVVKKLKGNVGSTGKTGPTGKEGLTGKEGKEGKEGKLGEKGAAGSAVGYADIAASGVFQVNTTPFNATEPSKVATGEYCFANLPFTPHSAMVSADNSFAANTTIVSVLTFNPGVVPSCPVRVRTYNDSGGAVAPADEPFNIWFH